MFVCEDRCVGFNTEAHPGKCGCDTPNVDNDGDFIIDCYEKVWSFYNNALTWDQARQDCLNRGKIFDKMFVCEDRCVGFNTKAHPRKCGCDTPNVDNDGDFIIDCYEKVWSFYNNALTWDQARQDCLNRGKIFADIEIREQHW
eukprot:CAMPEP_0113953392 /NCGR_PEP_ID=MMETSP1339-20121228/90952_1 /TAXON_ID=94617 /ORGANISM="Fibrocapsa japonica" /LENGTH=142 /DNA_ID=CAMNT_0000962121 /DNA_START=167 /DNA_END=592 /DNA_ORIENTATION=- /assembly_acc=CAM_ASM_000762